MTVRPLAREEIDKLREIDRTERVDHFYTYREHRLICEVAVGRDAPPWPDDPEDDWGIPFRIRKLNELLDAGGVILGAFDGERLAALASIRYRLTDTMAELRELYVSREYRRQGLATQLLAEICGLARNDGASELYVSATESESAVGFYLSQGFRPTDTPQPELLALEPEDIHMVKPLEPQTGRGGDREPAPNGTRMNAETTDGRGSNSIIPLKIEE